MYPLYRATARLFATPRRINPPGCEFDFRNQIVLTSPRPDLLQKVIALVREQGHLATQDRIAVDVDPVSLL